jgi:uncharacterized protein (TIGR01777 family)
MRVLVSGSHGLVGQALVKSLTKDGDQVVRLVRKEPAFGEAEVEWHPHQGLIDSEHLKNLDAVVHLAGESIASGRWTEEKKKQIRESRVSGTELLSKSLARLPQPPATFVCASAIGFYGDRGDEVLTEQSSPGSNFLARVCLDWERATSAAAEKGIRVVSARFGIILDAQGGALAQMLPPFRLGAGGRIGGGKQWMSWIALDDVVGALRFVLGNKSVAGPVNFVAPNPVTNSEFTKTLGHALSRPTFFPIPAFGVRLAFGEMGSLLLASQRVTPTILQTAGYSFEFSELKNALSHLLKRV